MSTSSKWSFVIKLMWVIPKCIKSVAPDQSRASIIIIIIIIIMIVIMIIIMIMTHYDNDNDNTSKWTNRPSCSCFRPYSHNWLLILTVFLRLLQTFSTILVPKIPVTPSFPSRKIQWKLFQSKALKCSVSDTCQPLTEFYQLHEERYSTRFHACFTT